MMEENAPQQQSVQAIPSSNSHADGATQNETPEPQSPDEIIPLDGTNDLPTLLLYHLIQGKESHLI